MARLVGQRVVVETVQEVLRDVRVGGRVETLQVRRVVRTERVVHIVDRRRDGVAEIVKV